jgi:hypothetical protein
MENRKKLPLYAKTSQWSTSKSRSTLEGHLRVFLEFFSPKKKMSWEHYPIVFKDKGLDPRSINRSRKYHRYSSPGKSRTMITIIQNNK